MIQLLLWAALLLFVAVGALLCALCVACYQAIGQQPTRQTRAVSIALLVACVVITLADLGAVAVAVWALAA